MLDYLIRNGWVADGTGNPTYPADVALQGDRIVDVGRLPGATARRVIDARGKIVCPGFIDSHSHTDW
ncbi:MAG: amidohydrolase family protein, partial [Chloroflexota bacterium]